MKKNTVLFLALVIILVTFACSSGPKPGASTQETIPENTPLPTATVLVSENNAPEQKPIEIDLPALGDPHRVEDGGFAFSAVPGYDLNISGGMVSMMAPGADPDTGPVLQLMGWKNDSEKTNEQLYDQLKNDTPMTVSPASPIQVAGVSGITADIAGNNNGKEMMGKVAMVMVTPQQQFILMLGAPQSDWDSVSPLFDAVLASIEFFELVPPPPTSSLSTGMYAYTNSNVVRDVAVYQGVAYAATLGGMVSWNLQSGYAMQYTPLQGMGHVSATAIAVCDIPETRVIVGTLNGLSFYDPSTGLWEQRSLTPQDSLVDVKKITRLFCDQANHRLLIGYGGLGILDLNTGEFQHITKQDGLVWEEITDITVAGKDIWVATGYKGVARISDGKVTTYTVENGLPDDRANSVAYAKDGTLWVGASSGMMSFKGNMWTLYGSETTAKLNDINEIEISADGKLWVVTAPLGTGRLCQFNPSSGTCDIDFQEPGNQPILALALDENNLPVYGTSKGLYTFDGSTAKALNTADQLVSNFVDSFSVMPDGKLWVGTDAGIQILDPADPSSQWITFTKSQTQGMGGNWASGIATGTDGVIWAAMINGEASRYQDGVWTSYKDIYSFNVVTVDAENRAWFGDDGKGIIVLNADGSQAMALTAADGLPSDNINALLTDSTGTIWIGTDSGLAKYQEGNLSIVFGKEDTRLLNRYIRDLALAPDGALIIGTFTGVASFDGQQVNTLVDFLKDGYAESRLTTLAVSPSGRIWVGTDKGLLYSDDLSTWTKLTTRDGLMTNTISALLIDPFGAAWIGGGGSNFDGGGILQIVP